MPVLEYCSAVWCSAADTHLKLLDRIVSGASFLTGGVLKCDLAHRRSVAVLCMLYKIRCNQMHPLYDALLVPHVPVRVTRDAVIAHWFTYAPPRCRTSQYSKTFIPLSVSLENDLDDPRIRWCGTGGFQEAGCCLIIGLAARSLFVSSCFPHSILSLFGLVLWGWSLRSDWVLIAVSQPCITKSFFKTIILI